MLLDNTVVPLNGPFPGFLLDERHKIPNLKTLFVQVPFTPNVRQVLPVQVPIPAPSETGRDTQVQWRVGSKSLGPVKLTLPLPAKTL